jgi:hypothetical protein
MTYFLMVNARCYWYFYRVFLFLCENYFIKNKKESFSHISLSFYKIIFT